MGGIIFNLLVVKNFFSKRDNQERVYGRSYTFPDFSFVVVN